MNPLRLNKLILSAALLLIIAAATTKSEPLRVGHVQVELVSEKNSIRAGEPFLVGLRVVPDEDWHVYWQNPGDAGLPPTMEWNLPDGFSAAAIHWPAPSLIEYGPLAGYGYHDDALYPVTITPPDDLIENDSVLIVLNADWLVCKESCIPGKATLSLSLPVTMNKPESHPVYENHFKKIENLYPVPLPDNWDAQASLDANHLFLDLRSVQALEDNSTFYFFAGRKALITHGADQLVTSTGSIYRLQIQRSPYSLDDPDSLLGVLAIGDSRDTIFYDIALPFDQTKPVAVSNTNRSLSGLFIALLFAFVGGLILNLMPCVLPVLSLKVLGMVQHANQSRRSAFSHGLVFTSGVVFSFWVIVGVMLLLQAGGAQLGWGFQLQSPTFVMILAGFLFLFALSLFGLFEIGFLVASAGAMGNKSHSGFGSAFVSGVTATLVATPCTAPFMGAALGFSLTEPPLISMLIYTVLALGMAAPYLLLSAFPQLLKFVPKPGRWMETLKQALGFVLAATVIWLGWVLAIQSGATALILLLGVLLLLSVAGWIYGRWGTVTSKNSTRYLSRVIALLVLVIALSGGKIGLNSFTTTPEDILSEDGTGISWQPFSKARLDELRTDGIPIFIDFTAAWCLSCQVNEQIAFTSAEVISRFEELKIVPLKADWTNRSAEIAKALASYGRNSVPLYVLYKPGNNNPILLPEIITPSIVMEALDKINPKKIETQISSIERIPQ